MPSEDWAHESCRHMALPGRVSRGWEVRSFGRSHIVSSEEPKLGRVILARQVDCDSWVLRKASWTSMLEHMLTKTE